MGKITKKCRTCKTRKRVKDFYKSPSCKGGRRGDCKKCCYIKHKSCQKLWRTKNKEKSRSIHLKHYYKFKDYYAKYHKEYSKNYYKNNKLKHLARCKVSRAIKQGKLKKSPCEVCGKKQVHGHHDDYSKPLSVRWLCVKHHNELHHPL